MCRIAKIGSWSYRLGPQCPGKIYALLHRWRDMCIVSHILKSAGIQGWYRPAEAVGLSPGSSPTFLLTHLHQAGLSNLKEEGLVFLILLIINYLD